MSCVLGKRLPRMYWLTSGPVSSLKYCSISHRSVRQVKYVYDCAKPALASAFITLGRVNASERKITSGSVSCTVAISHSQNPIGFVCGLSTRNVFTPCETQNWTTRNSSCHRDCQSSDSKLIG